MALAVLLVRLPFINFNVLSDDEAVYLMIGEALRHGAIPYVDIIDRKPLGIYLIFAFADYAFRDPLVGARLLGMLSTFAAAVMLKAFGERNLGLSPVMGAVCGLLYSTYALLFFGDAAQTPVFFMPLVIGAAALVVRDLQRVAARIAPNIWRLGMAGLLLGLSLQIKYSTVLECAIWGVLPLLFAWRQRYALGWDGLKAVVAGAGLMIVGGLLPTVIAYGAYAAMNHGGAFLFYNFTVNFTRGASQYPYAVILLRGSLFMLAMSPLAVMTYRYVRLRSTRVAGQRLLPHENRRWMPGVLLAWTAAAILAGLAQRQPFSHYFFDALAPLSLLAAAGLQWTFRRRAVMRTSTVLFALAVVGYVGLRAEKIYEAGSPYLPEQIAADLQDRGVHSMYVFNSAGVMYHFAHAPLPTRYPHPPMLTSDLEAASFDIDAPSELRNILGKNPEAVVIQQPMSAQISAARQQIVLTKLAQDYCLWRTYRAGLHQVQLYLHQSAGLNAGSIACERAVQMASLDAKGPRPPRSAN